MFKVIHVVVYLTFQCLFHARFLITKAICRRSFFLFLLGFFLNKLRWVIIIRSADIDRLSIFFNIHSKTYNFIMLVGIGKTLHNTWWNWWNITQHLVELVKHYTTLDGIGKTLHNTWWNWFFFSLHNTWWNWWNITQHLVELVKH